jgi:hypothetical protein
MSDPGPGPVEGADGGPLMRLLARGLELWLRQQCDAIEELQIQLEGSAAQLMRGRLEGVRLQASRVVFQKLELKQVELRSDPLQVRMGALLRSQKLRLEHPFQIQGTVAFSAAGLSRCLSLPPWSALGDALAQQLFGRAPLAGLRFEGDCLVLRAPALQQAPPRERSARLLVEEAGLVLQVEPEAPGGAPSRACLPRDANIRIERADLAGDLLELYGQARVTP